MLHEKFFFVGIDLSGPSNRKDTAIAVFEASGRDTLTARKALQGADDNDILHLTENLQSEGKMVVGIDAPLSYNVGGGDRLSDAELRGKIIAAGLRPGSVMTPTMTRMVYLTLRGMATARLLIAINEKNKVVEVHPGATMVLRGAPVNDVVAMKNNETSRRHLIAWLEGQGLEEITTVTHPSDHYVAACASAFAAWKWHRNESVWIYPAQRPIHPFDYAC